jgi:cytidylate kinase
MSVHFEIPQIQQIVARQIALWEAERRAGEDDRPIAARPPGPYLTVSRQHGSGGAELAQRLARRLAFDLLDRALLEQMAERANVQASAMERVELGPHDRLREAIQLTLDRTYPGHHAYLKSLVAVVSSAATRGRVVMLGRGAHLVLPPERGLRVRVLAPVDQRIERVMQQRACDRREAMRWVRQADESQAALVSSVLHRELDDPLAYDLVLNMAHLSQQAAEECVLAALHAKLGDSAPG